MFCIILVNCKSRLKNSEEIILIFLPFTVWVLIVYLYMLTESLVCLLMVGNEMMLFLLLHASSTANVGHFQLLNYYLPV
jgi:hypothetical protein